MDEGEGASAVGHAVATTEIWLSDVRLRMRRCCSLELLEFTEDQRS